MIFVDTGAWFAIAVQEDKQHPTALSFVKKNSEALVTSDLVIVETLNLARFRRRGPAGWKLANRLADELWGEIAAALVRATPEDTELARTLFKKYEDKLWSFTDCTSFAIMKRLGISTAFAFDRNFEQFPGFHRVP